MAKRKGDALGLLKTYLNEEDDSGDSSDEEAFEQFTQKKSDISLNAPKRARENTDVPNEVTEHRKSTRLPIPEGLLNMFDDSGDKSSVISNSDDGRIRSFDHFPGNWALHVYATFPGTNSLGSLIDVLVNSLPSSIASSMHMFPLNDLHVSLSRTVPIRHYWIEPITAQLKDALSIRPRFNCILERPHFYVNDEKTRSFLGLKIFTGKNQLKGLTSVVDNIFDGFSLPKYYENPSFHVSVAWCLGDIYAQMCTKDEENLQTAFESSLTNKPSKMLSFNVEEVKCKIGNKLFSYTLGEYDK